MKNSFKNLSFPELKVKRDELNRKYMEFRFQMVIGHVENTLIRAQEIADQKTAQAVALAAAQAGAEAQ